MKVFLKTYGCQMNLYDSEVARGVLENAGYTSLPEQNESYQEADVIIFNTCSVREHAEARVYGQLDILKQLKENKKPGVIIGLMGCMADEHGDKLLRRFPHLDFLCGTRNIKELPELIDEVKQKRAQTSQIKREGFALEYSELIKRESGINAWLPIMTGCNKECTFCVVPLTRGPEISMPAEAIFAEAGRLAKKGYKQITLLGQNVNSYGKDLRPASDNPICFPELLKTLNEIPGLELISFMTSHPEDANEELFRAISESPKVSRRFHLPLQSASNTVLKRMKRRHTIEEYKDKITCLRSIVPDIIVTTDIIVGFPGETENDFEATRQAIEEIGFESAYFFKYSPRQNTPAFKLKDDVPQKVKEKRHHDLLALQEAITKKTHEKLIGSENNVLVLSVSRKNEHQLVGITREERNIIFQGNPALIGTKQPVKIKRISNHTILGELVSFI